MAVVASLALVVPVLGCGGDGDAEQSQRLSKKQYQAAIFKILERTGTANGFYYDVVLPKPRSRCEEKIEAFHREIDEIISSVAALEPPANVVRIQDDFVAAAEESVDRVGEVKDDVLSGKLRCGRQVHDRIAGLPSSERADAAIFELESKG
jgi:hypothetical protein